MITLRELQRRVNDICAQHPERLDLPITFRLCRGKNDWWLPLSGIWGGTITVGVTRYGLELRGFESDAYKVGRRGSRLIDAPREREGESYEGL